MNCMLGVDAGGTYFKASLVTEEGVVVKDSGLKRFVDTNGGRETILQGYFDVIGRSLSEAERRGFAVRGIGISTPGPFDYENSASLMTHKMKSIRGVDLRRAIRENCRVGEIPIRFLHDSHAFLLGEYFAGAARGFRNAAAITIGTGTGFAVIRDGRLMDNGSGGPYISIYGRPFHGSTVEEFISNRGIVNRYRQLSGKDVPEGFDARETELRAKDGDAAARETYSLTGSSIAECLHDILREQRTECLVLGGQIAKGFPLMKDSLAEGLADLPGLRKIAAGEHIGDAAQIGAAEWILREENAI